MKKVLLIIIIILSTLILKQHIITSYSKEDNIFTVYIDPGHGGKDGGAISETGLREEDIVLNIALVLREYLENMAIEVLLIRETDEHLGYGTNIKRTDIHKRVELINNSNADLYISIHLNAIQSTVWRGAQTFYKSGERNKTFANLIQSNFINILRNTDRQSMNLTGKYLMDNVTVPGCLVEAGFLSNPEEAELLGTKDYQEKIALILYYSILEYQQIYS